MRGLPVVEMLYGEQCIGIRGRSLPHVYDHAGGHEALHRQGLSTGHPLSKMHRRIEVGSAVLWRRIGARRVIKARLGLPLYMNGNPPGIKELYEELCAENGTVPFCIAPEEAPQLFITEDPDRAWAELGEHFMLEARTYADWQPEGQNSPVHSHAMTVDDLREEGIYRFLTPDEAREFVAGAGACTLHPLVGGMPIDEAWRSVELFADAVLSGDS